MINRRFATFAWATLGLSVLVIIWGAYVRATGSGAGCGSHWPLCQGELIPQPEETATLVEFSHRITSGLAFIAVVVLLIWAFRAYPKGSLVRMGAVATVIFMILEALIGAALVLLEYVAFNVSIGRAIWMGGHLVNTFLLMGALVLTAWWASGGAPLQLRAQGPVGWTLAAAILGMFVLGVSGAITALGDTLTLAGGISPEENLIVGQLVALRVYHPLIAVIVGGVTTLAAWTATRRRPGQLVRRLSQLTIALFGFQLVMGALNVALKAPVWLQMVHLLITCAIWIVLVMLVAAALGQTQRASLPTTQTGHPRIERSQAT